MAAKKSLFIYDDTSSTEINTVNLTDDSVQLISSALSSAWMLGNKTVKSSIINFLESADGEQFYLVDLD